MIFAGNSDFSIPPELYTELINIIRRNSSELSPEPAGVLPVLHRMEGIKSVIFDIYGTLVVSASGDIGITADLKNTCIIKKAAENGKVVIKNNTPCEYLDNLFYTLIKKEHEKLRKTGIDHPEVHILSIWSDFYSELFDNGMVREYPSKKSIIVTAVYFEIYSNPVWPMPGLSKTLTDLQHRNIITGIVSNAQFYTPVMIEALTGRNTAQNGFKEDLIFYSFKYSRAKPSVFMFEKLREQLYNSYSIEADETIYIGNDMLNDILTAKKCGFKTALFAGDKRSLRMRKGKCADIEPDAVITELNQLFDIIGEVS